MALQAGTRLGPYEVLALIGAGGMGEVYRARDTRLGREVAVKVLPAERLTDSDRRRRFVQEAQAASALNHPHIITIYEIESANDSDFIVMEYVRGKSLDALIPRQGMRLGDVLRIAIPVADALASAHTRGIIHRDLKPANVMLGSDGAVKVLDFGLAKLTSREAEPEEQTITHIGDTGLSVPGTIAGTAAYMSPEQATGGRVDARSDIFSFGAMLYEMATGTRAFAGGSAADTLAAVLRAQPKLPTQVVATLPRELERLILRCLRKEPDRRFQTMLDVKIELQEIKEESDSGGLAPAAPPPRRYRALVGSAVALVLAVGAIAAWLYWRPAVVELPAMRVRPLTTLHGSETMPTLSPDGDQVVFAWNGDTGTDNFDIYVTMVGSATVRRLTTDPAFDGFPSWSPDGRNIAFARYRPAEGAGRVYVTSPLGGAERKLSDFAITFDRGYFSQISWSPNARYIAVARAAPAQTPGESTGIYLIPSQGGEPRRLTEAKAPASDRDPAFSPDGRRLAYLSCDSCCWAACDVMTVDLNEELAVTGAPRRQTSVATMMYGVAWTRDGRTIVYGTEAAFNLRYLWRIAVDGGHPPERVEVAGLGARRPATVRSRDRMVFARSTQVVNIHRVGPDAAPRPTIVSSFTDHAPEFSPDGRRIVFCSTRSGEATEIWVAAADGSAPEQLTRDMGPIQCAPSWAPHGRTIAFASQAANRNWHIWTVDADGGNLRQITKDPAEHMWPSWSRDGRALYFSKTEGGVSNIWRVAVAGGRQEQMTRGGGGAFGRESTDGKSLLYRGEKAQEGSPLLTVPLTGGSPRRLVDCVWGFSVGSKGVYYYPCRSPESAHRSSEVRLIDPVTGQDRLIGKLAGIPYGDLYWGPHASPDGTTLLYAKSEHEGEDLLLIENFR